jgi:XTP/dITP diphosphohydrolase
VNVNPEDALAKTNRKFINRFQWMENETKKDGKSIGDMSLVEMDKYWEASKKIMG